MDSTDVRRFIGGMRCPRAHHGGRTTQLVACRLAVTSAGLADFRAEDALAESGSFLRSRVRLREGSRMPPERLATETQL